jgi:D-amino-acid dehydrogenase
MSDRHAVVVGGGVIGTACAYYLAKANWRVTLVDRGRHGGGCSGGNCGLLAFSHVLPLNEPGAVKKTLHSLGKRDSPFYIKPRFAPSLWWWLLQFARRCNRRDMLAAARARAGLLKSAEALYDELLEHEPIDCEWERRGCLFVYQSLSELDKHAQTEKLLRETFQTPATRYDGQELVDFEPALKPGAAGGWLYAMDAHLRPDKLMSGWRRVLEGLGVAVREGFEVTGFARTGTVATAVTSVKGEIPADAFVVATGAVLPRLSRQLGCRIPIQPGKGYSITMPRPAHCPKVPIIFQEQKVAVTPLQSGYRLGSTMEFSGYDESLNRRRLNLLIEGARRYLHDPVAEPIESEWFGWRPMTYDGKPIIGPTPKMQNVFIAAGHAMIGTTLAPATGKLIAELVDGRPPHVDPAPFAVTRF